MVKKGNHRINVVISDDEYKLFSKFVSMHNEKNIRYLDFFNFEKISMSKILAQGARIYLDRISKDRDNFDYFG